MLTLLKSRAEHLCALKCGRVASEAVLVLQDGHVQVHEIVRRVIRTHSGDAPSCHHALGAGGRGGGVGSQWDRVHVGGAQVQLALQVHHADVVSEVSLAVRLEKKSKIIMDDGILSCQWGVSGGDRNCNNSCKAATPVQVPTINYIVSGMHPVPVDIFPLNSISSV